MTVVLLAVAAGAWWLGLQDPSRALWAFTSVLIVACPCALALSAPFALGTAQRLLGRGNVFLRNANVVEALAGINSIVLDKTGTLTAGGEETVPFLGDALSLEESRMIKSITVCSPHPHSIRIAASPP